MSDLIRTIEDDQEVDNLSVDSDEEIEVIVIFFKYKNCLIIKMLCPVPTNKSAPEENY